MELIGWPWRELNLTIILIEHRMRVVMGICSASGSWTRRDNRGGATERNQEQPSRHRHLSWAGGGEWCFSKSMG